MSPANVIAVCDIGRTNKKFFLIDESYQIVLEKTVAFNDTVDEDGDACDDLELLSAWVLTTLSEILQQKQFLVKAINFSAYGASLVYINEKGNPIAPLYSYLKPYPETLKKNLYEKYGGETLISCQTASPVLGSLNSGMQFYRLMKENPLLYKQVKYALHLPQYISYLVTGIPCSDITSLGSHTQLWDFQKAQYHRWVIAEGLDGKLAPILASDKTIPIDFNGVKMEAGTGLHDSSSALIPYLSVFSDPFVLISTGTWCISLNPFNNTALTDEELKKDCLCYLEYHGRPIKASRLFAGHMHEQEVKRLAQYFNKPDDFYKKIKYDSSILVGVFKNERPFDFANHNETLFDSNRLTDFSDYDQAYHCMVYDLVRQQYHATSLVTHDSPVKRLFVDGGFSNNSVYMHLLALAFPQFEVYAASVAQATAMGAALAVHPSWNPLPPPADMVKLNYYRVSDILNTA